MPDEVPFEVEHVFTAGGRPIVLARLLGPLHDVMIDRGATLDGYPLVPYFEIPRILRPDRTPRLDVFAFELRDARDLSRFARGRRVLLRAPRAGGPAASGGD
jgi:hypothetical protein